MYWVFIFKNIYKYEGVPKLLDIKNIEFQIPYMKTIPF